jgi:hypothetical protein
MVIAACKDKILEYTNIAFGDVAEWLRRGLQNPVHQFNSGRRLHEPFVSLRFMARHQFFAFAPVYGFTLGLSCQDTK